MKLGSDEDIDFGLGTATADRLGLVPRCHMPMAMWWRYVHRSRASVARAAPVAVVDQDMEGVVAVMELGRCGADRVLVGEVQRQHLDAGVAGAGDHRSGGLPTGPFAGPLRSSPACSAKSTGPMGDSARTSPRRDTSPLPQPSEVNLVERTAASDDAEFRTEVLMASRHLGGSID